MKLTIGMACHDDFHGVAFSVQSLFLHHDLTGCEILVVDNNPQSDHGRETAELCAKMAERTNGPVRYLPMAEKTGTTQSRERIFAEARGRAVLAMDCHVLFPAGTIARLKHWYDSNPDCRDLYSGPLILDSGMNFSTHFNEQWRGGMWGTWASAWRCSCKKPTTFTTFQVGDAVHYRDLATSRVAVDRCGFCGKSLPALGWSGHQAQLVQAGFQPHGFLDSDPPFEVPGQGLGVFTCRKDAWPGFNPHFRGFGGEELYIHEKFRRRGGKAICLPWLKWWHRFGRPDGVAYPLSLYLKVRNYVLGHQELGLDLAPVIEHFVSPGSGEGNTLSQAHWEFLLADPVGHVQPPPSSPPVTLETGRAQPPAESTLDGIFEWCKGVPRDLDKHLPLLRDLASKVDHATEITKRRESTVGLLAGRPATLVSYQKEADLLLKTLGEAIAADAKAKTPGERRVERYTIHWGVDSASMNTIEETDLLFLDSVMSGARLKVELDQHASRVRRFLVVRGTGAFGAQAEGSQEPGLFAALAPFVQQHPEWRIIYHTTEEYGLTALSRLPEDYPAEPINAWPPGHGPGTELKAILASIGVNPSPSCDCNGKATQMDMWGVAGCRTNFDKIVGWMREGAPRWSWSEKIAAAAKAVKTGLAFSLDWTDPFPSLIQEAIRRADEKSQGRKAA